MSLKMGLSTELYILLGLLAFSGAVVFLFMPRIMMLLVWPILLCYPQNLFLGLLPWNAGIDDVVVVLVAMRMLLHFRQHKVSPFAKGVVFLAIGMMMMEVFADFAGAMRYHVLLPSATKNMLKNGVLILFALAMVKDIRNTRDVHWHVVVFGLTMSVAFLLVIVCFYVPVVASYWEVKLEELLYQEGTVAKRAFGAFDGPAGLGGVVCLAAPLAIGLLVHKPRRRFITPVALLLIASTLAVLLLSKSRSGLFGLAGMFAFMTLFSKQRKYIIAMEVIGIFVVATFLVGGEAFGAALERFTFERLTHDLSTRTGIWWMTISNPSPWIAFCAEGTQAQILRLGQTPHNGLLDIVFIWGLGGVIMFTILIWQTLKWANFTQRFDTDSCCRGIAWGMKWGLVSIAGFSLSADPWYITNYRLLIYFLLAILCSRYLELRRQTPIVTTEAAFTGLPYPFKPARGSRRPESPGDDSEGHSLRL